MTLTMTTIHQVLRGPVGIGTDASTVGTHRDSSVGGEGQIVPSLCFLHGSCLSLVFFVKPFYLREVGYFLCANYTHGSSFFA